MITEKETTVAIMQVDVMQAIDDHYSGQISKPEMDNRITAIWKECEEKYGTDTLNELIDGYNL
ncbi:MAG: hypothetical protein EPN37_12290 [Chitinophagaceae bacterium]|nr:MAG: hypothetical protein EPN37_12290 [Chitinophagaceae bacterium]